MWGSDTKHLCVTDTIYVIIFLNFCVLLSKTMTLARLRDANSISLTCLPKLKIILEVSHEGKYFKCFLKS